MVLRSKLEKYIESSTVYILKEDCFKYRKRMDSKDKELNDNNNRGDNKDRSDSKDRKIRSGHMVGS